MNKVENRLPVAVLISGSGRTMKNLAQLIDAGRLDLEIRLVVASRPDLKGVALARELGLPVTSIARRDFENSQAHSAAVFDAVRAAGATHAVLAGFLSFLHIPDDFSLKVLNIHPSLLPAFGGQGMFGHHVHEAVLETGCKLTGCTVHFADEHYDTGPILVQRACPVLDDDTADTLAARVFEQECIAYPQALQALAEGRVSVEGRRVRISDAST